MEEDVWLDGFTRRDVDGRPGGTFTNEVSTRIVLHTVEGSVSGALGAYDRGVGCPHLTVSLDDGGPLLQHVPLNRSSYALRNSRGGTETNRDNAIQVEIEGFAAESDTWGIEKYMRLAYKVLLPIIEATGCAVEFAEFSGNPEDTYGYEAPYRMSAMEWDLFEGICGHQHVPENTHWDPGALNTDLLKSLLGRKANADMAYFEKYEDPESGSEYIVAKNAKGKIIVREFSSPRGDGMKMAGLSIVLNKWIHEGLVDNVS